MDNNKLLVYYYMTGNEMILRRGNKQLLVTEGKNQLNHISQKS